MRVVKPWAANKQVVVWGSKDEPFSAFNDKLLFLALTLLIAAVFIAVMVFDGRYFGAPTGVMLFLALSVVCTWVFTVATRFNLGFEALYVGASKNGIEIQYSYTPKAWSGKRLGEVQLDWNQIIHIAAETDAGDDGPAKHYACVKFRTATLVDGMRPHLRLRLASRKDADTWVAAAKGFR